MTSPETEPLGGETPSGLSAGSSNHPPSLTDCSPGDISAVGIGKPISPEKMVGKGGTAVFRSSELVKRIIDLAQLGIAPASISAGTGISYSTVKRVIGHARTKQKLVPSEWRSA